MRQNTSAQQRSRWGPVVVRGGGKQSVFFAGRPEVPPKGDCHPRRAVLEERILWGVKRQRGKREGWILSPVEVGGGGEGDTEQAGKSRWGK